MLTLTPASVPTVQQLQDLVGADVPTLASIDDVESVAALLRARYGLHTGASLGWSTRPVQDTLLMADGAPWEAGTRVPAVPGQGWSAGDRVYTLRVSPGTIAVAERTITGMVAGVDDDQEVPGAESHHLMAQGELQLDLDGDEGPKRGVIREWSGPSRARLVRAIAELDLSAWHQDDGDLCLVTVSLPASWEMYAPGASVYAQLVRRFMKRLQRAGCTAKNLWKREFQMRGAPHTHLLLRVPALVHDERFEDWARRAWADICQESLPADLAEEQLIFGEYDKHLRHGVDFSWSGMQYRDPRRIAIYFLKHSAKSTGSKEYQNVPPRMWRDAGDVGRFWGYAGLRRAAVEVVISRDVWVRVRRILRHMARADAWRIDSGRARHGDGVCQDRCVCTRGGPRRRRRRSLGQSGGWVLLKDALGTAVRLLGLPLGFPDQDPLAA